MKSSFFVSSLCVLLLLSPERSYSLNFNTDNIKTHSDWESLRLHLGEDKTYRAITINDRSNSTIALSIDFFHNDCSSWTTTVIADDGKSSPEDIELNIDNLQVRVDRYPVQKANAQYSVERGDSAGYLTIVEDEPNRFLEEISKGTAVRYKLPLGDESLFFKFSLIGSSAAIGRAYNMCKSNSDKGYFQQNPEGGASNEDYFL